MSLHNKSGWNPLVARGGLKRQSDLKQRFDVPSSRGLPAIPRIETSQHAELPANVSTKLNQARSQQQAISREICEWQMMQTHLTDLHHKLLSLTHQISATNPDISLQSITESLKSLMTLLQPAIIPSFAKKSATVHAENRDLLLKALNTVLEPSAPDNAPEDSHLAKLTQSQHSNAWLHAVQSAIQMIPAYRESLTSMLYDLKVSLDQISITSENIRALTSTNPSQECSSGNDSLELGSSPSFDNWLLPSTRTSHPALLLKLLKH